EKLFQWILRQQEEGSRVTTTDIVSYLQIHDCALEVVTITLSLEAIAVEVAPCSLLSNLPKLCQTVIFFPVDFCMYRCNASLRTPDYKNEVDFGAEESPVSPRLSFQLQQHPQTATQLNTSSAPFSSTPISAAKNSVFSNALSSPVRRSLQHYHSVQVGYHSNNVLSSANGSRNTETNYCHQQIREVNSPSPNDCMDMHADSPAGDFLL
ncbi:hypothetical protein Goshw_015454, partial [Gossypium schwendimanii]|nr:hypothetical protein [Gossypium schwendimanii]